LTNSRFIDGGTTGRSSGGEGVGVDNGEGGVGEWLKLALVNIKAGSFGTVSSGIQRSCG